LLLLVLIGSSCFTIIQAQQSETVNLKQAVQIALDSNLAVRSSAYRVELQKALKAASLDVPKTSVDGQYGQFNSYTKDNSITVSQSFAFPTVYASQFKLAKANIINSEWEFRISQLEIATQVKQVYWYLVYLHSKHKLMEWQDSLYTGFLRAAEHRARTGETNRLEMISARSQSLEIKNQLQQVKSDLAIYQNKLQILFNTRSDIRIADTVLHRADFMPENDSLAILRNPSVSHMQQQVRTASLERKVERSRMMPDFNIGFFSQTMQGIQEVDGMPRVFGSGDRFSGFQAGVAIPLWFMPYVSKMKAAKLNEQLAQNNAEYYYKSAAGNYVALMEEFAKYSRSIEYYEHQAIPEADLIIDHTARSYKAGAMDYTDYILNLSRGLSIKQNYLDALNSYNQTIISIEYITGKIF